MQSLTSSRHFLLQWLAFGILLLVLIANLGQMLVEDRKRILDQENASLINRTRIVGDALTAELGSLKAVLVQTRDRTAYWKSHPDGRKLATEHLQTLSAAMPALQAIMILEPDGSVFATSSSELEGTHFRQQPFFVQLMQQPKAETLYLGEPLQSAQDAHGMYVSCLIALVGGEFGGAVSALLKPESFSPLLESVRYRPDSTASIVHGRGRIFLARPAQVAAQSMELASPGSFFSRHRASGNKLTLLEGSDASAAHARIAAYANIEAAALQMDNALVVGMAQNSEPLLASWRSRLYQQTALLVLLAMAGAWWLTLCQRRSRQRENSDGHTLRESELRFRSLADRSPFAIQAFSPDGTTLRVNTAWERLWQAPFAALKDYNVLKDQQLEALGILPLLRKAFAGEAITFPIHRYDKRQAAEIPNVGGQIWIRAFAYPVHDEDGRLLEVVLIQEDISERKQMEDQIRQLAFYDALTGLPNRRLASDRLIQIMATTKRSGCYGALMFLDLDHFKQLKDTHGHEVGDQLLVELANRLKHCVRETDNVGRFGGDEFIVMLSELNSSEDASMTQARIVAEKISAALSEPYRFSVAQNGKPDQNIEHRCTTSIGVALFIDHELSQEEIIKRADKAMYQAKSAGRNLIRFHEPAI